MHQSFYYISNIQIHKMTEDEEGKLMREENLFLLWWQVQVCGEYYL